MFYGGLRFIDHLLLEKMTFDGARAMKYQKFEEYFLAQD